MEAVANGLAAVLDKILSVYQTVLKAAVEIIGAVLTGDFVEALEIAIRAACDVAGVDSTPIFDFIDLVIDTVVSLATRLYKKGKDTAKKVKDTLVQWWKVKRRFKAVNGATIPCSSKVRSSLPY